MKAKARESKTKENFYHLKGGSLVVDVHPIDEKVMDVDKNILMNIVVDADSDIDGSVIISGDDNNEAWNIKPEITVTQEEKRKKRK